MYYDWNEKKNKKLKKERNISFERIQMAAEGGKLLDTFDHPNQERYLGQKVMVVEINGYAYLVPYVKKEDGGFFLKTIIPSRKATKKYLRSK